MLKKKWVQNDVRIQKRIANAKLALQNKDSPSILVGEFRGEDDREQGSLLASCNGIDTMVYKSSVSVDSILQANLEWIQCSYVETLVGKCHVNSF